MSLITDLCGTKVRFDSDWHGKVKKGSGIIRAAYLVQVPDPEMDGDFPNGSQRIVTEVRFLVQVIGIDNETNLIGDLSADDFFIDNIR